MSKGYSADELLDAIKLIENESVRQALQALWMFETGDSALAYKDFYRTQLEHGADIALDSEGPNQ
jgi:hypothetical protein